MLLHWHGQTYMFTEEEKRLFGIAVNSPCNLCANNKLCFALKRLNHLPREYCTYICDYSYEETCNYRNWKKRNFSLLKNILKGKFEDNIFTSESNYKGNMKVESLLTKAHIKTNIPKSIMEQYKYTPVFIDEDLMNMVFTQEQLTVSSLQLFKNFVARAIDINKGNNGELESFFFDSSRIINDMMDCTKARFSYKTRMKYKELIIKNTNELCESYDLDSMRKIDNTYRYIIYELRDKIKKFIPNLFENIINVFEDIYKLNSEDATKRIIIDPYSHSFSYIIDERHILKEILENACRWFIASSSIYIETQLNRFFPEYEKGEDYAYFRNEDLKHQYKVVYRLKRGKYRKDTLFRYNHKLGYKTFTRPYFNLMKMVYYAIMNKNKEKILVVSFKDSIKNIRQHEYTLPVVLGRIPTKYPVKYDWWGNLEATNLYNDIVILMLFGVHGRPHEYNEAMKQVYGFTDKELTGMFVNGEWRQAGGRLRDMLSPNLKEVLQFSCYRIPYFEPFYVDMPEFTKEKYDNLLNWIKKNPYSMIDDIMEGFYKRKKNKRVVKFIIEKLVNEKLLNIKFEKSFRGKRTRLYYI